MALVSSCIRPSSNIASTTVETYHQWYSREIDANEALFYSSYRLAFPAQAYDRVLVRSFTTSFQVGISVAFSRYIQGKKIRTIVFAYFLIVSSNRQLLICYIKFTDVGRERVCFREFELGMGEGILKQSFFFSEVCDSACAFEYVESWSCFEYLAC